MILHKSIYCPKKEGYTHHFFLKNDIWYATNIEVYDYIMAIKFLRFSGDKLRVYNPSSLDIWISIDGNIVKIEFGKTVELL